MGKESRENPITNTNILSGAPDSQFIEEDKKTPKNPNIPRRKKSRVHSFCQTTGLLALAAAGLYACGGEEGYFNKNSETKKLSGPNEPLPYEEFLARFANTNINIQDFDTPGEPADLINTINDLEYNSKFVPLKDGTMRLYFLKAKYMEIAELYYAEFKNGNVINSGIKSDPTINNGEDIRGFAFHAPSGKAYLIRNNRLFECVWDTETNNFKITREIDIRTTVARLGGISGIAATTTHLILGNNDDIAYLEIEDAPTWEKLTIPDDIKANTTDYNELVGGVYPDGFTFTIASNRPGGNGYEMDNYICPFNPSKACTLITNPIISTIYHEVINTFSPDGCTMVAHGKWPPDFSIDIKFFQSSAPACQGGDPDPSSGGTSEETSAGSANSITTPEQTDGTDTYEYNHSITVKCDDNPVKQYIPANTDKTPKIFGGHCTLEAPDGSIIEFNVPKDKFEIRERAFVPEENFRQFGIILHEGSIVQSNITHIPPEEQAPGSFVHYQIYGYPGVLLAIMGTEIKADIIATMALLEIKGIVEQVEVDENGQPVGEPKTIDCPDVSCKTSVEKPESAEPICGISAEKKLPPEVLTALIAIAGAIIQALKKRKPETPEEKIKRELKDGFIDETKNPQWK